MASQLITPVMGQLQAERLSVMNQFFFFFVLRFFFFNFLLNIFIDSSYLIACFLLSVFVFLQFSYCI